MCILFISSIKDSGSAGVGPIQSDAELLGILFQGGDTVPQETCRNQRALNRDDPKVAICSIIAIKHSARGEYWYANTHNRPHCKNCTARIDRGGWRGKTIDAINRLDHQPLGPGNGHVGACENEHQVNPENDLQGRSNYTDEYKFLRRSTSNSPRTRYSGTNTAMKSVNSPRRDQSTRHRRSKRPPYSPSTAQAITMKHSKKHISQHEGGRSAPIEIADTPEPQPKSESAPEEEDLSRFIVDDDVDHRETAGYHAQSSDSYSGSSEESLLNDLPADVAIEDDRPIAQNLRPRTGEPTNYKHCYQESIRKNRVFSNGRLLHWDEDGADNEDGERERRVKMEHMWTRKGQDLDSEGDMWGGKVNDNPFTANPGDTEDAYIEPKTAAQGPKRLRRNPRQAKSHAATNLRQKHGTDLRRTARDSRSNNSAGHEPNGDSHLVSGDGLSLGYLEEWSEKTPERPRVSLRGARRADPSSSSNTKRKRTLDAGQRVLRTMLLAHERPSDRTPRASDSCCSTARSGGDAESTSTI